MRQRSTTSVFLGLLAFAVSGYMPVLASEYIVEHEGGYLTLHVTSQADQNGVLRAALEFSNELGWKTYWRDPGPSGIPPSITASSGEQEVDSTIHFPHPIWISEAYARYPGYLGKVTLPVEIRIPKGREKHELNVHVLAGVCREICIPVMGRFEIPQSPNGFETELRSIIAVNTAFAELPAATDRDKIVDDVKLSDGYAEVVLANNIILKDRFIAAERADRTPLALQMQSNDDNERSIRVVPDGQSEDWGDGTTVWVQGLLDNRPVSFSVLLGTDQATSR
ncbi:MAG: protein-disulfide reductase DsbD domain-containing protein [Pseudomonadota bacterium]